MAENHGIWARWQAVILSQEPLGENAFRAVIDTTGFAAGDIQTKTCEKEEPFPFMKE